MNFYLLKNIHIVSVAVVFALLFIRGIWQLRSLSSAQEPWVRILPIIFDVLLLLSAVGLLVIYKPSAGEWLTAKLSAVALYVILVTYLVRFAKTFLQKLTAWLVALADLLFITSISVLHDPRGIWSLF